MTLDQGCVRSFQTWLRTGNFDDPTRFLGSACYVFKKGVGWDPGVCQKPLCWLQAPAPIWKGYKWGFATFIPLHEWSWSASIGCWATVGVVVLEKLVSHKLETTAYTYKCKVVWTHLFRQNWRMILCGWGVLALPRQIMLGKGLGMLSTQSYSQGLDNLCMMVVVILQHLLLENTDVQK